jgi:hypothetical protein
MSMLLHFGPPKVPLPRAAKRAPAAIPPPPTGTQLWVWQDAYGWGTSRATVVEPQREDKQFWIKTKESYGTGDVTKELVGLPDDTLVVDNSQDGSGRPTVPPASVLPKPGNETQEDLKEINDVGKKPSSDGPICLKCDKDFEVKNASAAESQHVDAGVGLFALRNISKDTVITRYAGNLANDNDFKISKTLSNKWPSSVNRGTHFIIRPGGAGQGIDGYALSLRARAGEITPKDKEAGLAALANSAYNDSRGRGANCALQWRGARCYLVATDEIKEGEELLANYTWKIGNIDP